MGSESFPEEDGLWERYSLSHSSQFILILEEERSRVLIRELHEFVAAAFYAWFRDTLPAPMRDTIRLDLELLQTALESACIDLVQTETNHDLDRGPEPPKQAGAITAWLNRVRPLQFTSDATLPGRPFVNAIFALSVGWTLLWMEKNSRDGQVETPEAVELIADQIRRDPSINDLIYQLAWRNPSYREMALLFRFLKV